MRCQLNSVETLLSHGIYSYINLIITPPACACQRSRVIEHIIILFELPWESGIIGIGQRGLTEHV